MISGDTNTVVDQNIKNEELSVSRALCQNMQSFNIWKRVQHSAAGVRQLSLIPGLGLTDDEDPVSQLWELRVLCNTSGI